MAGVRQLRGNTLEGTYSVVWALRRFTDDLHYKMSLRLKHRKKLHVSTAPVEREQANEIKKKDNHCKIQWMGTSQH